MMFLFRYYYCSFSRARRSYTNATICDVLQVWLVGWWMHGSLSAHRFDTHYKANLTASHLMQRFKHKKKSYSAWINKLWLLWWTDFVQTKRKTKTKNFRLVWFCNRVNLQMFYKVRHYSHDTSPDIYRNYKP